MTTNVRMKSDDNQYSQWKEGDEGYIDGYVRGGDNRPLAAVVIRDRIVLAPPHTLEVIGCSS